MSNSAKAPLASRKGIVVALITGTLMASLDSSIINVSLPTIMTSMHTSLAAIEWVVTAYMMGFAVVMPLTQWLKDRFGFFHIYFFSLLIFTLGSAMCGWAPTLNWLITARIIQALGGSALTPTAMSVIATIYSPSERGKILGLWGLGVVMGPALGPTLGGVMTQYFGWPSIFLINIPIGCVGLYLTWKNLRPISKQLLVPPKFDLAGFIGFSIFLIALLHGIALLEKGMLLLQLSLVYFMISIISLCFFVQVELRSKHPLIDLNIFKNQSFVACLCVTFSRAAALFGGVFLLPFFLQNMMGFSETKSGMLMFPGSILVALLMPFAGRYSDARGPRGISGLGLLLLCLSMWLFSNLGSDSSVASILIAMCFRGFGLGFLVTPIAVATVNSVPDSKTALASSLSSLMQQVGGAVGVATLAVFHELMKDHFLSAGLPLQISEQRAVQLGFFAAAILVSCALLPAYFVRPQTIVAPLEDTALDIG
jgi:EmrB/QacA subfamily drug resistance transporter